MQKLSIIPEKYKVGYFECYSKLNFLKHCNQKRVILKSATFEKLIAQHYKNGQSHKCQVHFYFTLEVTIFQIPTAGLFNRIWWIKV